MVKIPRPGETAPPTITITIEAPMSNVETLTVSIQNSNTPQQLPKHSNREATLHALPANSGTIYFGNSSVNAQAFPLNPGAAQDTHIDDLGKIWIFGTKGDQLSVEIEWGVGEL